MQYVDAVDTYQRADGKWCSLCPECGIEQAYTIKKSAVRSTKQKTLCPECLKRLYPDQYEDLKKKGLLRFVLDRGDR